MRGFQKKLTDKKRRATKRFFGYLKRDRLLFEGCVVVLAAGGLIVWGMQVGHGLVDGDTEATGEQGNAIEVTLECPGWIDDNVEVGVFVSGDAVEEQLLFAGSGSQVVQVGAGKYELVPQLPRLMLADGSVLEASEPVAYAFEAGDGESVVASIIYESADASALDDSELVSIAETSFIDETVATSALLQARERATS